MKLITKIQEFVEYCKDFYNDKTGIYPIATNEEIENAVFQFMVNPKVISVDFDSHDREQVREIIGK